MQVAPRLQSSSPCAISSRFICLDDVLVDEDEEEDNDDKEEEEEVVLLTIVSEVARL